MKVKALRTLGTDLVAELHKKGHRIPALAEGEAALVPDEAAGELAARGLVEVVGGPEPRRAPDPKPPTGGSA